METEVLGTMPNMPEGARKYWEEVECAGNDVTMALEHLDRQLREHEHLYPCRCKRCEGASMAFANAEATAAKAYLKMVHATCNNCNGQGWELEETEGYQEEDVEYLEYQPCSVCDGTGLDRNR